MNSLEHPNVYDNPESLFKELKAANPSLPVPDFLSFDEVQRRAKQFAKTIFSVEYFDQHIG